MTEPYVATALLKHPSQVRSLVKTFTWRIAASLDTFLLGYLISGSFIMAGSIASLEVLTKMIFYYLHERAWAHVDWGMQ